MLSGINLNARIASKTLQETIDYDETTMTKVISFIQREWGEDFSSLIENGKKYNALDSMQSLWG